MKKPENNNLKKIISLVVAVVLVVVCFVVGDMDSVQQLLNELIGTRTTSVDVLDNNNPSIGDMLKIHYIDVGQGDSILLQNKNVNMLIDGGTRESAKKLVPYLESQNISTLDYVVATHPHEDHIGGLDDVINNFDIGHVLMPKKTASTKVFSDLAQAIKNKELKAEQPEVGSLIKLSDMNITVLGPVRDDYSETNDYSIALKVNYKDNNFVFTGDAENTAEEDILNTNLELKADILKAGHHGSSTSTSKEFLNKVNPTYAVISLGEGNSYGHPHIETLREFKNNNITVYRTDRNGTIIANCDGKKITFDVEKGSKSGYTDTNKSTNIKEK